MKDERWQHADRILDAALDLPAGERSAFLDRECGGDAELRARVGRLLGAAGDDESWLSPGGGLAAAERMPTEESRSGEAIGNYRLLARIGEGDLGEVYEALQERPVQRRVAIKLIRSEMRGREVVSRFLAGRQALAALDHPNVGKVFDAGVADDGRPFFVMELVQGTPIHEHCDRRRLGVRERLELFLPVCAGVQHAHHKAILHGDLRPTSVLVTEQGGEAVPRIVDFGVAKATAQLLTEETLFTTHERILGAPAYLSPEQAGLAGGIDARADIYALGAILYELLTGARPLEIREGEGGVDATLQRIRERMPSPPSARIAELAESAPGIALERGLDAPQLAARLRGDLDRIMMKALQKDPALRYASASELAADIRRHLEHRPVEAGDPGAAYRLGKLVRRHRAAISIASVLLLAVAGTVAGLTHALVRSGRERIAVHRALDDIAASLGDGARLRETIADGYRALGDLDAAERVLASAWTTLAADLGEDDPRVRHVAGSLANLYEARGEREQAAAWRARSGARPPGASPRETGTGR